MHVNYTSATYAGFKLSLTSQTRNGWSHGSVLMTFKRSIFFLTNWTIKLKLNLEQRVLKQERNTQYVKKNDDFNKTTHNMSMQKQNKQIKKYLYFSLFFFFNLLCVLKSTVNRHGNLQWMLFCL